MKRFNFGCNKKKTKVEVVLRCASTQKCRIYRKENSQGKWKAYDAKLNE